MNIYDGVIDLVWVDPNLGTVHGLDVDDDGRVGSDHAILRWKLPIEAESERTPKCQKGLQGGSGLRQAM